MDRVRTLAAFAVAAALAAGCADSRAASVAPSTPSPTAGSPSPSLAAARTPSPAPTTASPTATTAARRTTTPVATRLSTPAPVPKPLPKPVRKPVPLLVERLSGVGDAREVISVTSDGYGSSYATLQAFTRTASGWRRAFGPWAARIGYNGFAASGEKREGDGRTPTGSFGFQFMFGVDADPGVHFAYRRVSGDYIVWDDDSASPSYNLWVDTRTGDAGRNPEPMHRLPSYAYGAVIGYNTARTPHLGSAIFLHVSHTGATSGCVSVAQSQLLALLRWLEPSAGPRIIMGTTSAVTR